MQKALSVESSVGQFTTDLFLAILLFRAGSVGEPHFVDRVRFKEFGQNIDCFAFAIEQWHAECRKGRFQICETLREKGLLVFRPPGQATGKDR